MKKLISSLKERLFQLLGSTQFGCLITLEVLNRLMLVVLMKDFYLVATGCFCSCNCLGSGFFLLGSPPICIPEGRARFARGFVLLHYDGSERPSSVRKMAGTCRTHLATIRQLAPFHSARAQAGMLPRCLSASQCGGAGFREGGGLMAPAVDGPYGPTCWLCGLGPFPPLR